MTTTNTHSQSKLNAISRTYFAGKNYNDKFWYDEPVEDGEYLTGNVYETVARGKSRLIGQFKIASTGYVLEFPGLPEGELARLNTGIEEPGETSPEEPKAKRGRPRKNA